MITSYDILKSLVRTEKSSKLEPQRKYFFHVADRSNKIQIRKAVEDIYNVKVSDVSTLRMPAKRKRVRREFGHTTPWKKAIVTLHEGQQIDVT